MAKQTCTKNGDNVHIELQENLKDAPEGMNIYCAVDKDSYWNVDFVWNKVLKMVQYLSGNRTGDNIHADGGKTIDFYRPGIALNTTCSTQSEGDSPVVCTNGAEAPDSSIPPWVWVLVAVAGLMLILLVYGVYRIWKTKRARRRTSELRQDTESNKFSRPMQDTTWKAVFLPSSGKVTLLQETESSKKPDVLPPAVNGTQHAGRTELGTQRQPQDLLTRPQRIGPVEDNDVPTAQRPHRAGYGQGSNIARRMDRNNPEYARRQVANTRMVRK